MTDLSGEPPEPEAHAVVIAPDRRRVWPGAVSLGAAIVMVVVAIVGLNLSATDPGLATVLGFGTIALSLIAVVSGIVAIARSQGRGLGIAGIVIGVLLNPAFGVRLLTLVVGVAR